MTIEAARRRVCIARVRPAYSRSFSRNQSIASTRAGMRSAGPPGNIAVPQSIEDVETLGLAGDGFGHEFACDSGQRDAVPGEPLQVIDVGREPSEIRGAAHGDVDVAAPGVFDLRVGELRKHLEHAGARRALGVARVEAGIADAPAEQQPVVGRPAEVVEHEVHVRDCDVFARSVRASVLRRATRWRRCTFRPA